MSRVFHDASIVLISLLVVTVVWPGAAVAIVLSDREDDHIIVPGQPSYELNLDGVAALGTDSPNSATIDDMLIFRCSGALVSDRHLLTVAHCLDTDYDGQMDFQVRSVPFVAAFELADRDVLIQVETNNVHWPKSWPESDTDVAILELMETAPTEIPRYVLYAGRDEIGKPTVLAGYGDTGFGDTGVDLDASASLIKRAGLNRIEDFFDERELEIGFDFDSGDEAHNAFPVVGAESDLGFGKDEVLTSHGDSGGPVFIDGAIAGVSAFNPWLTESDFNDEFDQSWGEVGFATRVSSFAEFIIDATNGEVVFVPEPGSPCPFWLAFLLLGSESKRKTAG